MSLLKLQKKKKKGLLALDGEDVYPEIMSYLDRRTLTSVRLCGNKGDLYKAATASLFSLLPLDPCALRPFMSIVNDPNLSQHVRTIRYKEPIYGIGRSKQSDFYDISETQKARNDDILRYYNDARLVYGSSFVLELGDGENRNDRVYCNYLTSGTSYTTPLRNSSHTELTTDHQIGAGQKPESSKKSVTMSTLHAEEVSLMKIYKQFLVSFVRSWQFLKSGNAFEKVQDALRSALHKCPKLEEYDYYSWNNDERGWSCQPGCHKRIGLVGNYEVDVWGVISAAGRETDAGGFLVWLAALADHIGPETPGTRYLMADSRAQITNMRLTTHRLKVFDLELEDRLFKSYRRGFSALTEVDLDLDFDAKHDGDPFYDPYPLNSDCRPQLWRLISAAKHLRYLSVQYSGTHSKHYAGFPFGPIIPMNVVFPLLEYLRLEKAYLGAINDLSWYRPFSAVLNNLGVVVQPNNESNQAENHGHTSNTGSDSVVSENGDKIKEHQPGYELSEFVRDQPSLRGIGLVDCITNSQYLDWPGQVAELAREPMIQLNCFYMFGCFEINFYHSDEIFNITTDQARSAVLDYINGNNPAARTPLGKIQDLYMFNEDVDNSDTDLENAMGALTIPATKEM